MIKSRELDPFDLSEEILEKGKEIQEHLKKPLLDVGKINNIQNHVLKYIFRILSERGWKLQVEGKKEVKGNKFTLSGSVNWLYNGKKAKQADFDAAVKQVIAETNDYDSTGTEN